jgi:hypothetical protein
MKQWQLWKLLKLLPPEGSFLAPAMTVAVLFWLMRALSVVLSRRLTEETDQE